MAQDPSPSKRPVKRRPQPKGGGRAKTRKSTKRWLSPGGVLGIMLLLLLVAVGFINVLNDTVRRQFEGKRWALPARVYAHPLELLAGMQLPPEELADELASLGYRRTAQLDGPGSFTRTGNTFRLITRPFTFWDGSEP